MRTRTAAPKARHSIVRGKRSVAPGMARRCEPGPERAEYSFSPRSQWCIAPFRASTPVRDVPGATLRLPLVTECRAFSASHFKITKSTAATGVRTAPNCLIRRNRVAKVLKPYLLRQTWRGRLEAVRPASHVTREPQRATDGLLPAISISKSALSHRRGNRYNSRSVHRHRARIAL
jgi:hypothetical protein